MTMAAGSTSKTQTAGGGVSQVTSSALLTVSCWLISAAAALLALWLSGGGAALADLAALSPVLLAGPACAGAWFAFRAVVIAPVERAVTALERGAGIPTISGPECRRIDRVRATLAQAQAQSQAAMAAQAEEAADVQAQRAARSAERARADADRAKVMSQLRELFHRLADGDMTARAETPFPDEYEPLRNDVNSAMVTINTSLIVVRRTADEMLASIADVAEGIGQISGRSDTQSRSLSETTSRISDLSGAVRSSAASISQASESVAFTKAEAESSDIILRQTVEAMEAIVKATSDISQVASVIDSIAFQTNLLAVNASVEAARAGDSGRGFAVVATEVRALAQRTADHAKGISGLIQRSNEQVERGRALVNQTGETLHGIVEQVSEIAEFINEIAGATRRQADTLGDVNTVAGSVDSDTRATAEQIRRSLGAANDLRAQAEELTDLIEKFRITASRSARAA